MGSESAVYAAEAADEGMPAPGDKRTKLARQSVLLVLHEYARVADPGNARANTLRSHSYCTRNSRIPIGSLVAPYEPQKGTT